MQRKFSTIASIHVGLETCLAFSIEVSLMNDILVKLWDYTEKQ